MRLPNPMSAAESRKVLEEIQRAKTSLKQSAAAANAASSTNPVGINVGGSGILPIPLPQHPIPGISGLPSISPQLMNHSSAQVGPVDACLTQGQRATLQSLQQANSTSFGSFIATDSHFGNGILPVLPRIPPPDIKPREF